MKDPTSRLMARANAVRSRAAVRRWEIRQLDHAGGVWYRLTRRLALSRRAWSISDEDAAVLLARGFRPDRAGLGLEPPRRHFVIAEEEVAALPSAREVPLQTSAELLACPNLALVPFAPAIIEVQCRSGPGAER